MTLHPILLNFLMYEENFLFFFISVLVELYTPWGTTRPYLLSISALIYSIFFIPSYYILLPLHLLFLANLLSFLLPQLLFSILCSLLQLFFYFCFTSSQPFFYIFTSSTFILLFWCFSSTSSGLLLKLFFFYFVCSFTFNYSSSTFIRSSFLATYFCFIQSSFSAALLLLEKFALLLCKHPYFSLHPLFFSTAILLPLH
jgi:hypothetical protein